MLPTLVHRARAMADEASLPGELQHLHDVFRTNGYSECQIQCAFATPSSVQPQVEMADSDMKMTILPFSGVVYFRIRRLLLKAGVCPIF